VQQLHQPAGQMVPFCRNLKETRAVLDALANLGLKRDEFEPRASIAGKLSTSGGQDTLRAPVQRSVLVGVGAVMQLLRSPPRSACACSEELGA
jgi:hypothetical protein